MKNKNLRRLSILITAQTAYHLYEYARLAGYKEIGKVVDKLVREHQAMRGSGNNGCRREKSISQAVQGPEQENRPDKN